MTPPRNEREFASDGMGWTVKRDSGYHCGFQFTSADGRECFLPIERKYLPGDVWLQNLGEEELCDLLRRAEVDVETDEPGDPS